MPTCGHALRARSVNLSLRKNGRRCVCVCVRESWDRVANGQIQFERKILRTCAHSHTLTHIHTPNASAVKRVSV